MERKRFQAFYSKKAGFQPQITVVGKKQGDYETRSGRLLLRAFSLEDGSEQIKMMLDFVEVDDLARHIKALVKSQEKNKSTPIVHITQRDGKESKATITLDRFQKGKLAVVFQRDDNSINVALSDREALAFASLLQTVVFPAIVEEESVKIEGEEEQAVEESEDVPFVDEED